MKKHIISASRFWLLFTLFFVFATKAVSSQLSAAMWITRWDYQNPDDIKKIVQNAADYGFNKILFQVRGNGTVFYHSKLEPWSEQFDYKDPGWDPLQIAIDLAHAHDIELHAWVNVYPAWCGFTPPKSYSQLYYTRPDWFLNDQSGKPRRLSFHYVWLSPTNPDVQDYLLNIFAEIYNGYNVDGLHLDYIRYPSEAYLPDKTSIHLFKKKFGTNYTNEPKIWADWCASSITKLVAQLYKNLKSHNQNMVLSASVMGNYIKGINQHHQDSHKWLDLGIVDAIYPMIYTNDNFLFREQLLQHKNTTPDANIFPGIYAYNATSLQNQVTLAYQCGSTGISIFSYEKLFPHHYPHSWMKNKILSQWQDLLMSPKDQIFADNIGKTGPVIDKVHTIPSTNHLETRFKIAAKIADPRGIPDDPQTLNRQGIFLYYGEDWPHTKGRAVKMSRINKSENWYLTDQSIPAQDSGLDFRCRIIALDTNSRSKKNNKRNMTFTDIWSLSILNPYQTYISKGTFGPILWYPTCIEIDSMGRIWIGTNGSDNKATIIVLNPDGTEAFFSPLDINQFHNKNTKSVSELTSLAFSPPSTMCIASANGTPRIHRINTNTGQVISEINLNFIPGKMDCDAKGRIFIVEKNVTRWHVLTPSGIELKGSPYGSYHRGTDIAVLDNSNHIFISDSTTNSIQCWQGKINGTMSKYNQFDDLKTIDTEAGIIKSNQDQYVAVPHGQGGLVTIFNKKSQPVEHLVGWPSNRNKTKNIGIAKSDRSLYVLEAASTGPSHLYLWLRN